MKTIEDHFAAYLAALVHGNRPAMSEAIGNMHAAVTYEDETPPSFQTMFERMEEQIDNFPDEAAKVEYGSSRMSEVAARHAKRFHRDWVQHMPQRWRILLSEDVFEDVIRRAMEDLVGETRQAPSDPPTPNEVLADLKSRYGVKRDS